MTTRSDEMQPAWADSGQAVLAVDVGGTDLKAGLLTENGRLTPVARRPTPRDPADPGTAIVDAVAQLASVFRTAGSQFDAIGVTVPGIVDEQAGVGIASTNLGWKDFAFSARLSAATGLPVAVSHDVRAAGSAEHRLGAARGATDAAVVTIGTGVAAALIVQGRLYRGRGYAGEIGHSIVLAGGPECRCGKHGCLEAVGSARAIVERYGALSGDEVSGASDVIARADARDPHAILVWSEALDALAGGLAQLSAVLAPEVIVIGGGLSEAGDILLEPLRNRVNALRPAGGAPAIRRAQLGQDAGIWGAALAARDMLSAAE